MISGQEVMGVPERAVTQAGKGHSLLCSGEARSAVRFGQDEGGEGDERRVRGLGRVSVTWLLSGVWLFIYSKSKRHWWQVVLLPGSLIEYGKC